MSPGKWGLGRGCFSWEQGPEAGRAGPGHWGLFALQPGRRGRLGGAIGARLGGPGRDSIESKGHARVCALGGLQRLELRQGRAPLGPGEAGRLQPLPLPSNAEEGALALTPPLSAYPGSMSRAAANWAASPRSAHDPRLARGSGVGGLPRACRSRWAARAGGRQQGLALPPPAEGPDADLNPRPEQAEQARAGGGLRVPALRRLARARPCRLASPEEPDETGNESRGCLDRAPPSREKINQIKGLFSKPRSSHFFPRKGSCLGPSLHDNGLCSRSPRSPDPGQGRAGFRQAEGRLPAPSLPHSRCPRGRERRRPGRGEPSALRGANI